MSVADFLRSFNGAFNTTDRVVNAFQEARDRRDMQAIADAKPEQSQGFTAEDGQQLEAIANAKDENGNPYYTVSANDNGSYNVKSNFKLGDTTKPETMQAAPDATVAQRGVTDFLGQRTGGTMSDAQVNSARQRALAGVLMRRDPAAGARMLADVTQQEQNDARFVREKTQWDRQDTEYNKQQDYEQGRADAFANTYYGRATADYAQQLQQWKKDKGAYDAAVASGQTPAGPAPVQPTRAAYSIGQSLADEAALLGHDAKFGKLDTAQFAKFTERQRQVQEQGYSKVLRLAQNGASLDEIAKAANASGTTHFDPSAVVKDEVVKNAQGVPSRVITLKDGTQINALAELDALGQAQDTFSRYFQGRQDQRADKSLALQGAHLAVSQAQAGASIKHLNAQTGELERKTAAAKEYDDLVNERDAAIESGDQARITQADKKLAARIKKGSERASPLMQKAALYLESGDAKNLSEALRMANQRVQESPAQVYDNYGKPQGGIVPDAEQVKAALAARDAYLREQSGGGIGSDPKAAAIRDDKTLTREQKIAKLKALGY